jgi:enamine deaminase RidA (YjgF/YER057c/UK114 family)
MKKSSVAPSVDAPIYYPMAPVGGVQLPFSEAVQLHDTLYVSGQIGLASLPQIFHRQSSGPQCAGGEWIGARSASGT